MTRDVSLMWESALDVFVINKILKLLSINVLILMPCVIPKPCSLLQFKFHQFSCYKTIVATLHHIVWRDIKHYWDRGCIFVYRLMRCGRPFAPAFQKSPFAANKHQAIEGAWQRITKKQCKKDLWWINRYESKNQHQKKNRYERNSAAQVQILETSVTYVTHHQ